MLVDVTTASGLYRIDLGNERFYVGSAKNLRAREAKHRSTLVKGKHHNRVVQSAFNLRGVFDFKVLELCEVDELITHEQQLLDEHFNDPKCANLLPVAGSALGMKHTPEARVKISAAGRTRERAPVSEQARQRMSAAHLGNKPSAETRAKMSAARTGHKHSPETLARIGAASRNRSPETLAKMSASRLGKKRGPISEETRAKLSAANLKKNRGTFTAEHRANISTAAKARWARQRAIS